MEQMVVLMANLTRARGRHRQHWINAWAVSLDTLMPGKRGHSRNGIKSRARRTAPPVLATGGIGSGRQMAAALALGAKGVWCGSIWLTTIESECSPLVRQKLIEATSEDTVRTRCYTGKPARYFRSSWIDEWIRRKAGCRRRAAGIQARRPGDRHDHCTACACRMRPPWTSMQAKPC